MVEKWCGRDGKREVMTTAGDGGGVFGVSKGKTQPTGNPSVMTASSLPSFWVHWKAAAVWRGTPKEGLGCQHTYMYNQTNTVLSIPALPSRDRVGFSLLLHHLRLPNNLND